MKKAVQKSLILGLSPLFVCIIFSSCAAGGADPSLTDLQKYQNTGSRVAAREWSENYDCSNFSTQFYQDCLNAALPCRVRTGVSGGEGFTAQDHAWNSVKIDGVWVNWEPQSNQIYNGHTQTWTPLGAGWGNFFKEDIARIVYESVGKYVPEHIIDRYEIDTYWDENSPFYRYFVPVSYCLSDDPDSGVKTLVSKLKEDIPDNNSGNIFIIPGQPHLFFFYKYNGKYYAIENIEESDPLEGRSSAGGNFTGKIKPGTVIKKLNIDIGYRE
jgi:hypothetical protein